MDVSLILKVAGVGILVAVAAQILSKSGRDEQAMLVGIAGITQAGTRYKVAHRAELGVTVLKSFWHQGIGTALMNACIRCAREAGYSQLELTVVAENENAVAMYQKAGFRELGRNPKGFRSRTAGYQETIFMALDL